MYGECFVRNPILLSKMLILYNNALYSDNIVYKLGVGDRADNGLIYYYTYNKAPCCDDITIL